VGCKLKRKIKSNTNLVRIQYKPGENVGRPGWEGNVCGITWGCTDAVLMHTSSFPASLCKEQITKSSKGIIFPFPSPPFFTPSLVVFFIGDAGLEMNVVQAYSNSASTLPCPNLPSHRAATNLCFSQPN